MHDREEKENKIEEKENNKLESNTTKIEIDIEKYKKLMKILEEKEKEDQESYAENTPIEKDLTDNILEPNTSNFFIENLVSIKDIIINRIENLENKLENLKQEFIKKNEKNKILKQAFDKLYEEMKEYKENFIIENFKPFIMEIILLYDRIKKLIENTNNSETKENLNSILEDIIEILYRHDVELIPPNDKLDKKLHKVLKKEITDKEKEDKQIVKVIREGFLYKNRVLRPTEVIIKKYKKKK